MYKLCFYVPEDSLETVKTALFAAGAGRIGQYDQCCWQTKGEGQFRPLPGSDPAIGKTNVVESLVEYKVELICDDQNINNVVDTLKRVHPYETPAFQIWQVMT